MKFNRLKLISRLKLNRNSQKTMCCNQNEFIIKNGIEMANVEYTESHLFVIHRIWDEKKNS